MLKNYILISLRNLRKHFSYSLINISGLGLGLATCLLLVTWIRHELSYDKFNEKADRIYRASLEYSFGGQVAVTSVSPTALLPALLTLPETETGVRVYNVSATNPYIIKYGDQLFQETDFYVADSTFFDVFSYRLIRGNPKKALAEPYTVVLTESAARKYFGQQDPVGKVISVNNTQDYTVTGVMEDAPGNSLLQFNVIASFYSLEAARKPPIWWSANYQTFVVIHENASLQRMVEKTNAIVKEAVASNLGGESDYVRYNFMPLTDIYLKSEYSGEPEVVSDIRYVYIFSAVAFLILVIACINYINLATARAADRAKEVGIRKVVGAVRKQLFTQFIGESVLITLFSFILAFFLAQVLMPFFNQLTGKNFSSAVLLEPGFILSAAGALLVIALVAGSYPALAITSFRPVSVLKGNFKASARGLWLRKSLVVFQFGISIVLIMGTITIVKQLDFLQAKNLGYDRQNIITLPLDKQTREVFETLKTELVRNDVATHVGRGSATPVKVLAGYSINTSGTNGPGIITTGLCVDEGYIPATGMALIEGRNFTKEDYERAEKDTVYTFILNEAALAALYFDPATAVGKPVSIGSRKGEIIGVVKDFHFTSLHTNIGPLVMFPEDQFSKVFVKLPPGDVTQHLEKIRNICTRLLPHRPFDYEFVDQQYAALYTNEQRMSSVFIVFAVLAIIIACLGLLGLVAFSAVQRTKEIGIRKVLGATAPGIILLITKDFTRLVVVAIVLGLPLGYWAMTQWLENFAYKTTIGPGPLLLSSVICICIALGTAGYQAVKAALIDPAKTLRSE